jgi:hypothetical protein
LETESVYSHLLQLQSAIPHTFAYLVTKGMLLCIGGKLESNTSEAGFYMNWQASSIVSST